MESELNLQNIKDYLSYDPETGIFMWIKRRNGINNINIPLTCKNASGYIMIKYNYNQYFAHRLAWWWIHGEFPKVQLDHINGIRYDNRLINLRQATIRQNARNRPRARRNHEPCIYFRKDRSKRCPWTVSVRNNGILIHVGQFKTKEQAIKARNKYDKDNNLK